MARFALRNKKKISDHYSKGILTRIYDSLLEYFKGEVKEADIKTIGGNKYKMLVVHDCGHTDGIIMLHIISIKYDVYTLAFSEFTNKL